MLPTAIQVAEDLQEKGISTQVVSMHTVKPLDETLLKKTFNKFSHVFTLEEHSILGGFGGSVAEWLSDNQGLKANLKRLGTRDEFMTEAGEQDHARKFFGISRESILKEILKEV